MKKKLIMYITIFLGLFGLLMIYSSSKVIAITRYNNPYKFVLHQGIFFIVGIIIMFILKKTNYQIYYKYANKILLISFILLIIVLIPGIGIIRNGSRSWIGISIIGFQPSELSKRALIIFVSKYLSRNNKEMNKLVNAIPILLIIGIIFFLILLEPDFGTGLILVLSLIVLLFSSNMKMSFFTYLGVMGIIGIIILIIIAPYRLSRITSFLNPWSDPLGSGFQIIQSMYAIGPGGIFGLGLGNSIQKHFYLPEPQTDFIFAIISEELGIIGILILTLCYLLLFYKVITISLKCHDLFGRYLSLGLILELILQTLLNLLVVVGLIPVTGVTLPFISYGGSSLLTCYIMTGIILNIESYQN